MSAKQTVTINGRQYDVVTGLPVQTETPHTTRQSLRTAKSNQSATVTQKHAISPAATMHQKTQRSQTLNRKFVKKPELKPSTSVAPATQAASVKVTAVPAIKHHPGRRIDGIRKVASTGSAARTNLATAKAAKKKMHLQPVQAPIAPPVTIRQPAAETPAPHPALMRAHAVQAQKKHAAPVEQPAAPAPSVLKQAAINEAMDNAPKHHAKQYKQKSRRSRLLGLVSGFAALVLFAGYLTYLNVPNLSVRVAAAQAGIDASYPGYQPDGYKLNGPVAFSDGQVRMKFAANTGESGFTLSQSRSGWDSNALLENYVKEKSDGDYTTSREKGITVYSYKGNAAWVSGGILYTIDGDAPLSPDQIRKIATSV